MALKLKMIAEYLEKFGRVYLDGNPETDIGAVEGRPFERPAPDRLHILNIPSGVCFPGALNAPPGSYLVISAALPEGAPPKPDQFNLLYLQTDDPIAPSISLSRLFEPDGGQLDEGSIIRLLDCKSLQELADAAPEYLKNPIIITGAGGIDLAITASAGQELHDSELARDASDLFERSVRQREPVLERNWQMEPVAVRLALISGDRPAGYLSVALTRRPFRAQDLNRAALIGALILKSLPGGGILDSTEVFISALIENGNMPPMKVSAYSRAMGWSVKEYSFVLSVVQSHEASGESGALGQALPQLTSLIPGSRGIVYNNGVALLFGKDSDRPDMPGLPETLRRLGLRAGVSRAYNSLADTARFYMQASFAVHTGLLIDPEGIVFYYDEYLLFHILEACPCELDTMRFCLPGVIRLYRADLGSGSSFIRTLRCYIKNGGNPIKTAGELYIHRNTVKYRISQITKMLNMDILDSETLFHISLSLKILDYHEKVKKTLPALLTTDAQ